ncbi:MAG: DUF3500 domain-containing protein [Bryobacteraceae bacterium]
MESRRIPLCVFGLLLLLAAARFQPGSAQGPRPGGADRERAALAEPFRGITTDGTVIPGLFSIRATGVSTEPVRKAAEAFIGGLAGEQRMATLFDVDDPEWRRWNNIHRYTRQGISFKEMTEGQRELAFALFRAGLSAKGLKQTRDIMRLNHTIAELTQKFHEYGEGLYWITIMGTPSPKDPWGWQLDGHHLIVNYFVLGDQVVMTPTFMGSEPVRADSGKYAGTVVMQDEQNKGLAFVNALTEAQRGKAILRTSKPGNNILAQAFQDNLVLDYAGLRCSELDAKQKEQLLGLIGEYVGWMSEGHARVRMEEVRRHLDATYFAWIGETKEDSVFYYRIHSPVVLIEFDHQMPVALPGPRVPGKEHVHAIIRTPNGNDYGKDILKQHYRQSHGLVLAVETAAE